jgi:hypothetical protein
MSTTTAIDSIGIDRLIHRLRALVPPAVVAELEKPDFPPMHADGALFEVARWLDDVVADRRQALADQVRQMQALFEELADALLRVRSELVLADSSAAASLAASVNREQA